MFAKLGKKFTLVFISLIFLSPVFVLADTQGQTKTFFVDSTYDAQSRTKILATLEKVSQYGYFYLESGWYKNLTEEKKAEVKRNLTNLAKEFDNKIYPTLTSIYGSEWRPGIDNDYHIAILFQQMKEGAAGYFRTQDEYQKVQAPDSNEREMVYLAAKGIFSPITKSYLAHEFTHLITFNQKDRLRGIEEEIWLNELRADYSPTLLGYDEEYQGSNLQQRVKQFIQNPSDSLTEWQAQNSDYGVINIFSQYLVEHYGIKILADSLHSKEAGIPSLNEALKENGYHKNFSQVFTDWTLAIFLNDCSLGEQYCFKGKSLANLRVTPSLIFLPSTQMTSVSLNYAVKPWSGHWYRIMGGEGNLKVVFKSADSNADFKVPYVLCDDSGKCAMSFFALGNNGTGEISLQDFGKEWTSLTLAPSVQTKIKGFDGWESFTHFSIQASMEFKNEKEKLIEALEKQIAALKAEIAKVQAQIVSILKKKFALSNFAQNLHMGMKGTQVRLLQNFLKSQGSNIYPEGLVTGFFGDLTKQAVIRFQEKYAKDILFPLGLRKGTGYVGPSTRRKINEILGESY